MPEPMSAAIAPLPVILGGGVTGMAISRTLSAAGIRHALVCEPPGTTPRLGESLNPEGSLEAVRQFFPEFSRFFFDKRQVALFYGRHQVSFDAPRTDRAPAWWPLVGQPGNVQLLHVDRIGFDRALFDSVTSAPACLLVRDRAVALEARPHADRVDTVVLASGRRLQSSYVFDATNHLRVVPRQLGIRFDTIGEPRRVVFAHYRAAEAGDPHDPPPWMFATSLMRLQAAVDGIDGLAWCIPLGDYVSLGIGIDPAKASPHPQVLLDALERAYAERGLRVREAFPRRTAPVDLRYQHYAHERCHGRNWLLAGPTCCQVWFPSAAGVGSGLLAARLAPDLLADPRRAGAVYQDYMDQVTRSHARLDWLARDNPATLDSGQVRARAMAMVRGNAKRLVRYAGLDGAPSELRFGDALGRWFERDRLAASPLNARVMAPSAQGTRAHAGSGEVDAWMDPNVVATVPSEPVPLRGPEAASTLVDLLSGRPIDANGPGVVTDDVALHVGDMAVVGAEAWGLWLDRLRTTRRVTALAWRAESLSRHNGDTWRLAGRWTGLRDGHPAWSNPTEVLLTLRDGRIAVMRWPLAGLVFVFGEDTMRSRVARAAWWHQVTAVEGSRRQGEPVVVGAEGAASHPES